MKSLQVPLLFVILATLFLVAVGYLAQQRIVPINLDLAAAPLAAGTQRLVRIWLLSGLVVGVIVPLLVFLTLIRTADVRRMLGPYLLVLLFQIATETIMRRWFFTSMLVLIGTTYTTFRLWQLWQAANVLRASEQLGAQTRTLLFGLLTCLTLFWGINLVVVLLIIEWPRLLANV